MKNDNYQDIINLPHYVSKKRQQMPISDRAAQFAPFAALTGYEENIKDEPTITFTYFIYDDKKSGGKYIDVTNEVKKINITDGYITLIDKTKIPIEEIIDINGDIFKNYQID